jgi:menaquinone biosynthesis decarboxylase
VPFDDIQSFAAHLEARGDLARIRVEVDPVYEMTEIAIRCVKEQRPALLFERPTGSPYPVLLNMLATAPRIEAALGRPPGDFGDMLGGMAHRLMPPKPAALWGERTTLLRALNMRKQAVRTGPVGEVTESPDLSRLPVLKLWPQDGGRFVTFPLVLTQDPDTRVGNLGVYRMHVYDGATTGMHWQIQKGGGFHYHRAEAAGRPLPVAVALGGDPILLLCAVAPLPEGIDELAFAGFLRGKPVRMMPGPSNGLPIPADAEFVLEGIVPPVERRVEGPFGDHFGHYSHAAPFPVFHVKSVSRRRNPIYPAAVVGKPPQEDKFIGDALQEMTLPILRVMHPEVVDAWAYYETGFHSLFVVSVRERYQKEAVKAALGLLGTGQLSLTKVLVTVGPDVPVRNFARVLEAIRDHFDPAEDLLMLPGTPFDTLDFTSFKMNLGSKMVIDAVARPNARPNPHHDFGRMGMSDMPPGVVRFRILEEALLAVVVDGDPRPVLDAFRDRPADAAPPIVAAVSPDVDVDDMESLLWGLFTRFEPARDVRAERAEFQGAAPRYSGRLTIDATWKKGYPDPVQMDPDVVKKVDRRWNDYWK